MWILIELPLLKKKTLLKNIPIGRHFYMQLERQFNIRPTYVSQLFEDTNTDQHSTTPTMYVGLFVGLCTTHSVELFVEL